MYDAGILSLAFSKHILLYISCGLVQPCFPKQIIIVGQQLYYSFMVGITARQHFCPAIFQFRKHPPLYKPRNLNLFKLLAHSEGDGVGVFKDEFA